MKKCGTKRIRSQVLKRQFSNAKSHNTAIINKQVRCILDHADQIRSQDENVEMDEQMLEDIKNDNHNENNQDMH